MKRVENQREELEPRRPRRRRRRILIIGCLGTIFILFIGVIVVAKLFQPQPIEIAPGEPKSGEELNAWYPSVPDADNAALKFGALVKTGAFKTFQSRSGRRFPELTTPSGETDPAVMAKQRQAVDALHALLQLRGSRFPIDLSQSIGDNPRHVSDVRDASRSETSALEAAGLKGDAPECLARLEDAWRIGNLLKYEPAIASQNMRIALDASVSRSTKQVLAQALLNDVQLAELSGVIAAARDEQAFYRAFVGERCVYLPIEDSAGLFEQIDAGYMAAELTEMSAACRLSLPERVKRMRALKEKIVSTNNGTFDLRRYIYRTGSAVLPALFDLAQSHMGDLVYNDLIQCSIAIERHKLAHGAVPESLSALVPAYLASVPTDPYSGKPVLYKNSPDGYSVYSVGPDGNDDGGEPGEKSRDIVFNVEAGKAKSESTQASGGEKLKG